MIYIVKNCEKHVKIGIGHHETQLIQFFQCLDLGVLI